MRVSLAWWLSPTLPPEQGKLDLEEDTVKETTHGFTHRRPPKSVS